MPLMSLPFQFLVGGKLGSGKQWISWIHIDDEVAALQSLIQAETARGPLDRFLFGRCLDSEQVVVAKLLAAAVFPEPVGLDRPDAQPFERRSKLVGATDRTAHAVRRAGQPRQCGYRRNARGSLDVLGEPRKILVSGDRLEHQRGSAARHAHEEDRPIDGTRVHIGGAQPPGRLRWGSIGKV